MPRVLSKLTVLFDRLIGRRSYKIHRFLYRHSGGRIGHRTLAGPMLLLTTVGRKTGQSRTTPLLYLADGAAFVVVGSNAGRPQPPAWVLNLTATPAVDLQVGRRKLQAEARLLSGPEKEAMWPRLVAQYKGWGDYRQRTDRELAVVSLRPLTAR
jgi:deazaflavin-dependent oxidoreductase (nitroreductase family)